MRWGKKHVLYGGIAISALMGVLVFCLLFSLFFGLIASLVIQENQGKSENLTAYANAGQYLSFTVGIPLTLLAALIGAWISYQINKFTKSKDDFAILDFVDKVSSPVFDAQRRIAAAIDTLCDVAHAMKEAVEEVFAKHEQSGTSQSTSDRLHAIEYELAQQQVANLDAMGKSLSAIATQYDTLLTRMHSAMFVKQHLKRIESTLPVAYLKRTLPDSTADTFSTSSITSTVNGVLWLHARTTSLDLMRAYMYLPDQFTRIEFMGMVLFSPYFTLATPITLRDGQIVTGYTVNVGAAFLASLYASLPDKDDMTRSFRELMEIPAVATRYLETAGPSMREMALPYIDHSMATIITAPNRLIVLRTRNDTIFYNPSEHGDVRLWDLKQEDEQ